MKLLATDEVWQNITWKGTKSKSSFGSLGAIKNAIIDVCTETYKELTEEHMFSKMKSFLRHTDERIKRKCLRDLNS